ncbi:sodium:glutamate symporter [uncultured Cyclobacterium sp.]|uniref:sodium/glutamate symporter n=1 Tax=uncultured Cyclobacterium sp. TaxID=453820 RepID=UPI0030EED8CB|tara:strand:+ start:91318 stop:92664 length:1347 start_codon:yes stop_codon:yes gene_type:complete
MEKFATFEFFNALLLITLFLFIAYVLKEAFLKKLMIPASLIGGVLALLLGPGLLGPLISKSIGISALPKGLLPEASINIWKDFPAYLIVVVFAGLFLGKNIPNFKTILNKSMPNLCFGYTLALGQYIVGLLIAILLLKPMFDIDVVSGALIAIGFQGGHGTVAGLKNTFSAIDFEQGVDLGLGIATIGLISAIIFGTIVSNINGKEESHDMKMSDNGEENPNLEKIKKVSFPLQIAIVGVTIILGWLFLKGLSYGEMALFSQEESKINKFIPLFPVAMLAGLAVQVMAEKSKLTGYISRKHINHITNLSLDLLIVAAIGSLSIKALTENLAPLLILGGAGVGYNIAIYFLMGSIFFPKEWRLRALGEFGQSTGTTAIGLILIKRAGNKAEKYTSTFSYKQPLYEPIVGGGIVTGIALPLISNVGVYPFIGGMALLLGILLLLYFKFYK